MLCICIDAISRLWGWGASIYQQRGLVLSTRITERIMAAKGKKTSSKGPLKVAKRGEEKPHDARTVDEVSESVAAVGPEVESKNVASQPKPRSRQSSKQSQGVNPRKVSEGLKQLPPDAYRFVRESYLMLDSDGSGSVTKDTLKDMLASIGLRDPDDKLLNAMVERSGEPITFAGYLAVMGELLAELPSREELDIMLEAFQNKDGTIDEEDMKTALRAEGITSEDIESVMRRFSKPTRHGDVFDAKIFANAMSI